MSWSRNTRGKNLKALFLLGLLLAAACGRGGPADFHSGEFPCDLCHMTIVDMRFKAEARSAKGRLFRFDAIECLVRWWRRENPESVARAWVTDFFHPEKWIPLEEGYFLKSEKLPSPMGAFLSAYSTPEDLRKAREQFGGRAVTLEELEKTLNGDCPDCPPFSLKEAVRRAEPGETIVVPSGVHRQGTVLIDKPLRLVGEGNAVVDGGHEGHVFYIRADDVTIENLTIQNSGQSDISELAGIRIENSRRCAFRNNRLFNNTYGIYLAGVRDCEVSGNRIRGEAKGEVLGGNGIHLWYSRGATIAGNTIEGHRDGLYLEFADDCRMENNRVLDNLRYGLHFMFSHGNRYVNNLFSDNGTGVAVMYSRHIEMEGNRFEKSWGRSAYGLLLKDITDSRIERNVFAANTVAVYADGSNRNRFSRNRFLRNGWGINIPGSSDSNIFAENDFSANYFNVTTNTKTPLNVFRDNYWSDYQGYDLDRDGTGEVAFRPMKMFSLWVARYPELVVLFGSPVVEFLEAAERVFPVLTPETLRDLTPRMGPWSPGVS